MNKVDCVIFDMDGVIVNTEPLHSKAYFKVFNELNLDISQEMYSTFMGASTINTFNKIKEYFDIKEEASDLVLRKRDAFVSLFEKDLELSLIDGVEDIIKYVYSKNIVMVLASSASMDTINRVFKRFGLDKYFVDKLSGSDLENSKPHPEIFENAAKVSGIDKRNCIVIEDSDNGILAANRAGIYCVAYKGEEGGIQTLATADMVISSYEELKRFI
ncbi:MAG: HAD-IA family hydrolase [Flavobacteriaceae bacterium]|nr:HAD-IA family hydrolase [Flavobacteriaceae bacterium]